MYALGARGGCGSQGQRSCRELRLHLSELSRHHQTPRGCFKSIMTTAFSPEGMRREQLYAPRSAGLQTYGPCSRRWPVRASRYTFRQYQEIVQPRRISRGRFMVMSKEATGTPTPMAEMVQEAASCCGQRQLSRHTHSTALIRL